MRHLNIAHCGKLLLNVEEDLRVALIPDYFLIPMKGLQIPLCLDATPTVKQICIIPEYL